MAAGVHAVVGGRTEVETGVLVQRQRIHVAPKQHGRPRLAAGEQRGDTRRGLVQGEVERQAVERLEHHVAGGWEVVADLGMPVKAAAQRHRLVLQVAGLVAQRVERHGEMVCPARECASPRGCRDRIPSATVQRVEFTVEPFVEGNPGATSPNRSRR